MDPALLMIQGSAEKAKLQDAVDIVVLRGMRNVPGSVFTLDQGPSHCYRVENVQAVSYQRVGFGSKVNPLETLFNCAVGHVDDVTERIKGKASPSCRSTLQEFGGCACGVPGQDQVVFSE